MYRYFIHLAYKGTRYSGWQIQPDSVTVQKVLEDSIQIVLKENIKFVGVGRTDAGVHARNFYAHFDSEQDNLQRNPNLIYKLNCILPDDIVVFGIYLMHAEAHARFDAVKRTYKYYIALKKEIYQSAYVWQYYLPLNIEKMNIGAFKLMEYNDFSSFCKLHSNNSTSICHIIESNWKFENNLLVYTISADRFLRNMVRAIVGTLIEIGKEKLSIEDFCAVIERRQRSAAGMSVPPSGLFLEKIEYPYSVGLIKD
jgi:tRNA pseudouridine38-40 synthase